MLQYLDGIIALILLSAGAVTMWYARKRGQSEMQSTALTNAESAVNMMRVQVEAMRGQMEGMVREIESKRDEMAQLTARIEVLESLISQRYDLSQIQEDLAHVRDKIDELT